MSTGANILARYELEADGFDINLINELIDWMSTNVQQFDQSKRPEPHFTPYLLHSPPPVICYRLPTLNKIPYPYGNIYRFPP